MKIQDYSMESLYVRRLPVWNISWNSDDVRANKKVDGTATKRKVKKINDRWKIELFTFVEICNKTKCSDRGNDSERAQECSIGSQNRRQADKSKWNTSARSITKVERVSEKRDTRF